MGISGKRFLKSKASFQSNVSPVPPKTCGACASSRIASAGNTPAASISSGDFTPSALTTGIPASAKRFTVSTSSSPWSCTTSIIPFPNKRNGRSLASFTKTPTRRISPASPFIQIPSRGSRYRFDCGQKLNPTASTPSATSLCASASSFTPQIFSETLFRSRNSISPLPLHKRRRIASGHDKIPPSHSLQFPPTSRVSFTP